MSAMVPFRYIEFYDVPRAIILCYMGKRVLLQSAFDEKADEYPDDYSVYILPDDARVPSPESKESAWTFLQSVSLHFVGKISVRSVKFDVTKRKTLDPAVLKGLV